MSCVPSLWLDPWEAHPATPSLNEGTHVLSRPPRHEGPAWARLSAVATARPRCEPRWTRWGPGATGVGAAHNALRAFRHRGLGMGESCAVFSRPAPRRSRVP